MEDLKQVYSSVRKNIPYGELFAVGGCVRDSILGIKPKDYDFATNLKPEEVRDLFKKSGRRVWEQGIRFGTVGSKVEVNGKFIPIEITTYRTEKYQNGCRKPIVEFSSSLKDDLKRRDFTINSLAYNGEEVIDYFASKIDLLFNKRIKSVIDPKIMISDDPLRILRALRFSLQLDFKIEANLYNHLKRFVPKLNSVAIERQEVELSKMFLLNPKKALILLKDIDYLRYFIPEIDNELYFKNIKEFYSNIDLIWKDILSLSGEFVLQTKDYTSYITNNNPQRTKYLNFGICKRFKFSNKRTKIILGE